MANFPPQSPFMKKDESNPSVRASSTDSTRMVYAKRLVIELNNADLRETALTALSKVATFIVEKILSDHVGMAYVCVLPERYYAITRALNTLASAHNQPAARLVKLLVSCYTYLSEKEGLFMQKTIPPPS